MYIITYLEVLIFVYNMNVLLIYCQGRSNILLKVLIFNLCVYNMNVLLIYLIFVLWITLID